MSYETIELVANIIIYSGVVGTISLTAYILLSIFEKKK